MSSAERGAARRASKGLDALGSPMLAIADERMPVCVSVAEVCALPVGTGEACGGYTLRSSPAAFHLAPGAHRSRYWSCTQRASGGMSTDGAIVGGAGFEQTMERRAHRGLCSGLHKTRMGKAVGTQQRQREDEQDHEQVHMQVHEESSWLEMRQRDRFLQRRKNTGPQAGKSSG
jgi:hypothetical protein